jgi:hypothetical protein
LYLNDTAAAGVNSGFCSARRSPLGGNGRSMWARGRGQGSGRPWRTTGRGRGSCSLAVGAPRSWRDLALERIGVVAAGDFRPIARFADGMAYDVARDRVVLFGGGMVSRSSVIPGSWRGLPGCSGQARGR